MKRRTVWAAVVCIPLSLFASNSRADNSFGTEFNRLLLEGQIAEARVLAESQVRLEGVEAEARFAIGVAQFFQAVEGLGQDLHKYGFTSDRIGVGETLIGSPFLRLPIPRNPSPAPITYDAARQMLADFRADLETTERLLSEVPPGDVGLRIDLASVRLDLNGDGSGDDRERVGPLVVATTGLIFQPRESMIRFDESDVLWLRGYSHLLMAISDFALAHDWQALFDATLYGFFPQSGLPTQALADQQAKQYARMRSGSQGSSFYDLYEYSPDPLDPLYQEWAATDEGMRYLSYERDETALFAGPIADLIAMIHLMRWDVVEPERLRSSREHLLRMIDLSRANWDLILKETDDDAEWLPGPRQTSLFPTMQVDQVLIEGWMQFLDQFQAVLEGRLLLPHWRFDLDRGINLKKFFDGSKVFDPIMLAHGADALPYLEEGPVATEATVGVALQVFERGFLSYFVWFN